MSSPQKIAIFPIGTYERSGWFTKEIVELIYTLPYNRDYMTNMIMVHNFIPAAGARNRIGKIVQQMEPQPDWVCMIDNDMAPPLNLMDCIKDAPGDASVVVPKFFMWDAGKKRTFLCWGIEQPNPDSPDDLVFEHIGKGFRPIVTCGTGVIFIRPEVFKKVPAPWFFYSVDEDQINTATEDINFCLKLGKYGIKIYGNGGIEVGHNHTCDLSAIAQIQYPVKSVESVSEPDTELAQV